MNEVTEVANLASQGKYESAFFYLLVLALLVLVSLAWFLLRRHLDSLEGRNAATQSQMLLAITQTQTALAQALTELARKADSDKEAFRQIANGISETQKKLDSYWEEREDDNAPTTNKRRRKPS